jgi:uncharacterized membrane protein
MRCTNEAGSDTTGYSIRPSGREVDMLSKAKILGHPIHPMLVAFPVAFYVATLVTFIVYGSTHDAFWLRVANMANWAGVVMAGVAAVPGLVDWALAIPSGSAAKKTGLLHMALNVASLAVFVVNAVAYWNEWQGPLPDATMGTVLSGIGVLLTLPAGFLGWSLVQDHHVGVHLTREQERLEPAQPRDPEHPSRPSYVQR